MKVIGINASQERKLTRKHFYDHLDELLNLIPLSLGAGKYEIFHQYGTGIERKTARNDQEILKKVKETGAGLISSA